MRSRLARIGSFLIAIGVLASVPGVGRAAPSGGASPVTVPGGGLWKQVVAGSNQTCGLAADGTVWCWGSDALGQLGDGRATGVRRAPVAVSTGGAVPERFLEIDSSEVPTCALAADGTVWCWGSDTLHHDDDPIVASPTPVDMSHLQEGLTFAHLAVAGDAACAIASDGTVWCWGEPTDGTFEPTTDVARPERVAMPTRAPETFVQIDANAARFCAVASDGSIWCWGYTWFPSPKDPARQQPIPARIPSPAEGPGTYLQVAVGPFHTCALATDGEVWCWGSDSFGQLGDGALPMRLWSRTPEPVDASALPVGVRFTAVATGGFVTCATASDGTAWCWGQPDWGQLGGARGDAECFGWRCQTRPARTLVLEPRTVTAVSVGVTHACALAADGTILCWGTDTDGQLGDGPSR